MTNYLVRTYTTAILIASACLGSARGDEPNALPGSCSISRPMPRPWSASHRTGTWSIAVKEAASTSGTPRLAARFEEFRSGTPRALRRGPSHPRPTAADSFPWAARWTRRTTMPRLGQRIPVFGPGQRRTTRNPSWQWPWPQILRGCSRSLRQSGSGTWQRAGRSASSPTRVRSRRAALSPAEQKGPLPAMPVIFGGNLCASLAHPTAGWPPSGHSARWTSGTSRVLLSSPACPITVMSYNRSSFSPTAIGSLPRRLMPSGSGTGARSNLSTGPC